MKILLITEFFPEGENLKFSGGVESRNFFIAKELAKLHKVTILTSRVKNSKKSETMFNFKILRVGSSREYSATAGSIVKRLRFIFDATRIAKNLDFDIVEGSNYITHFIARNVANSKKKPVVYWYPDVWLGAWLKNVGIVGLLGEVIERINIQRGADKYIAISRSTFNKLQKNTNSKIEISPCGVDLQEFSSVKNSQKAPNIICVSRLASYKNIHQLIFAFAKLKDTHKNLKLEIVGTGPALNSLKSLSKNLHIEGSVTFHSLLPRKTLIAKLAKAKLFCLPSKVEGFGITVIEALAARTPYVISNIAVFREITKNGRGGFIYNLNSTQDMVNKIEKLLTNEQIYIKKQKEAEKVVKLYSWAKIANETASIYLQTIKEYENSSLS